MMAVDENTREKIRKQVQREFPGCKALQDLHYYRYLKEIEWQHMSPAEIAEDIKKGANTVRKAMETTQK